MTNDIRDLVNIEPQSVRDQVLHAYTRSLALIWYRLRCIFTSHNLTLKIGLCIVHATLLACYWVSLIPVLREHIADCV